MKARIIEKDSLSQMCNTRDRYMYGKMHWFDIDVDEVISYLDNDAYMVFTKKFGEVDSEDIEKLLEYKRGLKK